MKIISVDKNIIRKLRESGISTEMKSLESCDWVILYEENGIIGGAAGMGGMFNVSGIQLNENFRGRGIGKKIQKELIDESPNKQEKITFIEGPILLKILKTSFPKLIIYDEDELPSPDIKWIVSNFEKI